MRFFSTLLAALILVSASAAAQLQLVLPTGNENLYENPHQFYMQTARAGEDAWKGGMYGFTRDEKHMHGTSIFTRFHEGVDIAPVLRDARNEPLDSVRSIDAGVVVHASKESWKSNYGKYVVVRHRWEGSPFYSLYAHLNEVWVEVGDSLEQSDPIGRLGYTGDGINRARAHLHFEVGMLVSVNFQAWYDERYGNDANHHGIFNGQNFAGLDPAQLYLDLRDNPGLTIREFITHRHPAFYSILLPREARPDFLDRYPWLMVGSAEPDDPSWEIGFDVSGLPVWVKPSDSVVAEAAVGWISDTSIPYRYLTKSRVEGSKGRGQLSSSGKQFVELMTADGSVKGTETGDIFIPDPENLDGRDRRKRRLKRDRPPIRIDHTEGFGFTWRLRANNRDETFYPIVLTATRTDSLADSTRGVDNVVAECADCSEYGLSVPRLTRKSETEWEMFVSVSDMNVLKVKARDLDGHTLQIPIYAEKAGVRRTSIVTVTVDLSPW